MRKFKEKQAVYWNDPAGETSGVYEVLDTNEEYNAGITEAEILEFDSRVLLIGNGVSEAEVYAEELAIIDPPSGEGQALVQKEMENGFKMFIRNNGCQPDYAVCAIVWNDGSIYPEVNIRLSQTVNPATDDNIFFYCDGLKELKSLVFPGGEDFCIADILYFKGLCRITPNKKHDTKCHPHFLQQK